MIPTYSWTGMCVVLGSMPDVHRNRGQIGKEGEHVLCLRSAIGLTYGGDEREGHGSVLHD